MTHLLTRLAVTITVIVATTASPSGANPSLTPETPWWQTSATEPDPRPIDVDLPGDVLFSGDSPYLTPSAGVLLSQVLELARSDPDSIRISITGHTADTGTDPAVDVQLALDRAISAQSWLVAHGLPLASITVRGAGATEPVASNGTAEGRALNRRCTIHISWTS